MSQQHGRGTEDIVQHNTVVVHVEDVEVSVVPELFRRIYEARRGVRIGGFKAV